MEVCNELRKLAKEFESRGHRLYIVGGYIRNFLLGHKDMVLVSADGIHPSATGYDLIFGKLFEVLKNYIY